MNTPNITIGSQAKMRANRNHRCLQTNETPPLATTSAGQGKRHHLRCRDNSCSPPKPASSTAFVPHSSKSMTAFTSNDSRDEAHELAKLLNDHQIHSLVNLIPWNPVDGVPYKRSKPENIRAFQSIVQKAGIKCTVRQEKGADIDAACGQLRLRNLKEGG